MTQNSNEKSYQSGRRGGDSSRGSPQKAIIDRAVTLFRELMRENFLSNPVVNEWHRSIVCDWRGALSQHEVNQFLLPKIDKIAQKKGLKIVNIRKSGVGLLEKIQIKLERLSKIDDNAEPSINITSLFGVADFRRIMNGEGADIEGAVRAVLDQHLRIQKARKEALVQALTLAFATLSRDARLDKAELAERAAEIELERRRAADLEAKSNRRKAAGVASRPRLYLSADEKLKRMRAQGAARQARRRAKIKTTASNTSLSPK